MSAKNSLTQAQTDDLRSLSSMIIPESAEYRVPGADDRIIQADILATLGRDTAHVREALELAARLAGGPLAALDCATGDAVGSKLRQTGGPRVATATRVVLQRYYRADREVR